MFRYLREAGERGRTDEEMRVGLQLPLPVQLELRSGLLRDGLVRMGSIVRTGRAPQICWIANG